MEQEEYQNLLKLLSFKQKLVLNLFKKNMLSGNGAGLSMENIYPNLYAAPNTAKVCLQRLYQLGLIEQAGAAKFKLSSAVFNLLQRQAEKSKSMFDFEL